MKRIITLVLLAGASVQLFAQVQSAESAAPPLTFEEAVKIGLKNNVLLNTQKNNLYLSEARKLQGYANFMPSLSATAFAQRVSGLQIDPTTGQGSNINADNISGSINANYTLFNGFNRLNLFKQASYAEDAQNAFISRTEQDVIFNVSSQYLQVLLDQELLKIAEENLNAQRVLREQISGFVSVGSRAEADFYTQDAIVKNLEVTYLRAKVTLENDRSLLSQTLQLDPIASFAVVKPQVDLSFDNISKLSLDSLIKVAMANRKDLRQQELLVDAFKFSMRGNTAGYYPSLVLFGSYGSTYFVSSDNPSPASFNEQFTKNNPQVAYGVQLRIPIWDQFQTRTNRITQKVTMKNTALIHDNLVKTIQIDVQRAWKNYDAAIEAYKASLAQFEAADLALRVQTESYSLGIASQVVVAQATQTYVQGLASRAQAETTLAFQRIMLQYAMGTLKPEDVATR